MRNKKFPFHYFFIFLTLLVVLSFPKQPTERLRGLTVAMLAPMWEQLHNVKSFSIASTPLSLSTNASPNENNKRIQQLEIENSHLRSEVYKLQGLFEHELYLIDQLSSLPQNTLPRLSETIRQHQSDLHSLVKKQLESIPANVIYRSPTSWSSSVWINVGTSDNEKKGSEVIAKNSPVVVGNSIVGVIDYVGKNQSRVRLITDSGLTPSVRVARGNPQNQILSEKIQLIQSTFATQPHIFRDSSEKNELLKKLTELKNRVNKKEETWFLAKGEIHGSSQPLWRLQGQRLQGIGFNYDFSDDEGPARDLRTGQPINAADSIPTMPILQANDLLVTTGLDGVFPAGLHVATVKTIATLKEGDYFYELEALPTAGDLNEISLVFVMPPMGYDPSDKAPIIGR
jgi:rod shape-determining protein MreC